MYALGDAKQLPSPCLERGLEDNTHPPRPAPPNTHNWNKVVSAYELDTK